MTSKAPKRAVGSTLAKANMPAKAGRRKLPPAKKGAHITSPEDRARGRYLSQFGLKLSTVKKWEKKSKIEKEEQNLDLTAPDLT